MPEGGGVLSQGPWWRNLKVVQALLQLTVGRSELLVKLLLRARVIVLQLRAIKIHVFLELLVLWGHRKDPALDFYLGFPPTNQMTTEEEIAWIT